MALKKIPRHDPDCVDRNARDSAAETVREFMSGQITNDEFEDQMPITADPSIASIWEAAWFWYSDVSKHKLIGQHRLHPDARKQWIRWVLFLDSDLPYQWPEMGEGCNDPFADPKRGFLRTLRRTFGNKALHPLTQSQVSRAQFAVWPFFSQRDFRHALRDPKRLNIKRVT